MRTPALAFSVSMALLAGCAGPTSESTPDPEIQAAFDLFQKVFDETENPFEARRQVREKHFVLLLDKPWFSRNVDALTAILWTTQGGESAGAVCYMRGFQFGTAHHDQCVYEVKMKDGEEREAVAPRVSRQAPEPDPTPAPVTRPQGGKVYGVDECIGPVIMGRCHGTILPKRAYHPTCYGTWLNGKCTGPMF